MHEVSTAAAVSMTKPPAARHPLAWVPTLYLAQGLPFYAVALIAGLMFKSMGVPNEQIARWTGLLGFAWVFKALWSPFLELARSKKRAVVTFQLLGGASLAVVALVLQLPAWFALCIALLAVVSLASATHDIAADGLYIASLSAKQQAAYAGWQGAFFNAAKFLSLGGLVILAGYLEERIGTAPAWTVVFGLLGAALVALGLYHSWSLPGTLTVRTAQSDSLGSIAATLFGPLIVVTKCFRPPVSEQFAPSLAAGGLATGAPRLRPGAPAPGGQDAPGCSGRPWRSARRSSDRCRCSGPGTGK